MDAFTYTDRLVSYVIQYYDKFGIFINPNTKELLWPVFILARRAISQLILSGYRVGAFIPNYRMPIIAPISYSLLRKRVHQSPSKKILRNITIEENKGPSDLQSTLAEYGGEEAQDKESQHFRSSSAEDISTPTTLPIQGHRRINSAAQVRRHLKNTSFDSVYQGLKQVYEPASTGIVKAWLEQIKSLHLGGDNFLKMQVHN